jgi:hypothetical protein
MRVTVPGCNGSITGNSRTTCYRVDNGLLIETTFINANAAGATRSSHMTANLLTQRLRLLQRLVELFIVHMETGHENGALREILSAIPEFKPALLQRGQVFEF